MQPGDLLARLSALLRPAPIVELRALPGSPVPFQPGEQVSGEVLERLPGGRALVALGPQRQAFDLDLPSRFEAGERVSLTFSSASPRPTFLLQEPGPAARAPVQLSEAAQLLGAVAQRGSDAGAAPALSSPSPLLAAPPASGADLVPALAQAVTRSGLFYEAHQEQWAAGELSIDDILAEPQGRLSPRLAEPPGTVREDAPAPAAGGPPKGPEHVSTDGRPAVDPRLAGIVRQQAEALADARFLWRGEVWPRQEMEWEVGRDARAGEEPTQTAWYTRLRLELPRLGEVTALLRLDEAGLQVALRAEGDASAQALRSGRLGLEQALADAGLRLSGVVIDGEQHTR